MSEMLEFKRVNPVASFTLPAHPTVDTQLEYFSAYADTANLPMYKRLWRSARAILSNWDCSVLSDPSVDLTQVTDPDATTVIIWAGEQVLTYMEGLDALPKVPSEPS